MTRRRLVVLGLGAAVLAAAMVGIPWEPWWLFYGGLLIGAVGVAVGAEALSELDEVRPLRWETTGRRLLSRFGRLSSLVRRRPVEG